MADLLNVSTITTSGCVKFIGLRKYVALNIQRFAVNSFLLHFHALCYVKVQGNERQKYFFCVLIVYLQGIQIFF